MQQLSQAKKKWIKSLSLKKNRDEQQLFIAEGEKLIADLIHGGATLKLLVCIKGKNETVELGNAECYFCDSADMDSISLLSTAPGMLAVFHYFQTDTALLANPNPRWLVADGIKDPGNMGTLIRTAHWFGLHAIIAINSCAELYNPKTVQSTMGSLGRIPVLYLDVADFYGQVSNKGISFIGADLRGELLGEFSSMKSFALIIGSESHGLSPASEKMLSRRIFIPSADAQNRPESLNAAVSAGIILARIAL